jgi:pimeloyl-ACP methyl ester carboxylesterase
VTTPILFVHGLRTSRSMWRRQLAMAEANGIPAEAVDLPGHGHRMSERFTLAAAASTITDAVTRLEQRHGRRPYLVGFSLGGYLAVDWVAAHPRSVCGLLAASCGTVPSARVLLGWQVLARGIHRLPDRGLGLNNAMVRLFVSEPGATDVIAGGVALEVMDDVLRALPALRPLESLQRIDEPVLFVNGRWDHLRWHASRYLEATRHGRSVTIAGATHMVSVTRAAVFDEALLGGYRASAGSAGSSTDEP